MSGPVRQRVSASPQPVEARHLLTNNRPASRYMEAALEEPLVKLGARLRHGAYGAQGLF